MIQYTQIMMQLPQPGVLRSLTEDQRRSAAKTPNEPSVSKGGQAQRSDRRLGSATDARLASALHVKAGDGWM